LDLVSSPRGKRWFCELIAGLSRGKFEEVKNTGNFKESWDRKIYREKERREGKSKKKYGK
jgi:hypothetical protein